MNSGITFESKATQTSPELMAHLQPPLKDPKTTVEVAIMANKQPIIGHVEHTVKPDEESLGGQ